MKRTISLFLLFFVFAAVGCGNNNVGLKGKVVFADDKSPVPNGIIRFDSGTVISRGTIHSDGTFTMGSLKETDGLPPGTYKVFFTDVHEQTGESKASSDGSPGEPIYTSLIHKKYLSAGTSGLSQTINASTQELNFELERNPDFPKK
ncbi:MAG: hypothetical protein LBQ54_08710 [Planctomycetaceae bacterium]|jgi:hypothetical protein|nr:hypothetical protein [Planctomycetaceae bacterium]